MNTIGFLVTTLIIILIPGTGVVYTVSTGLTRGRKASFFAATGCTAGMIPHLVVSVALSSLLSNMSEKVFTVLKLIGALYLIYLGVQMMLSKGTVELGGDKADERPSAIMRNGILINLLNPKLTLFFFAFLPQYAVGTGDRYLFTVCLMGLTAMLMTWIVFVLYGALAGVFTRAIKKTPERIKLVLRLSGVVFLAFAVNLAFGAMQ